MAEILADSFSSVYSVQVLQNPFPHQMGAASGSVMDSVHISVDLVISA